VYTGLKVILLRGEVQTIITDMFIFSFPEKPLNFKSMDSYISFPLLQGNYDFKISFEIKPELRNALVLYMNGKSNQDHFAIAIINGILQLRLVI
jgi:hypothetical protein